jgi:hypothetical protein
MDPSAVFLSPDGLFKLETFPIPMRMSHEVNTPYLIEISTEKCLFEAGSLWEASDAVWAENSRSLTMHMRHYSNGTHSFELLLDLEKDQAMLTHGERSIFSGTFSEVQQSLKEVSNVGKYV